MYLQTKGKLGTKKKEPTERVNDKKKISRAEPGGGEEKWMSFSFCTEKIFFFAKIRQSCLISLLSVEG